MTAAWLYRRSSALVLALAFVWLTPSVARAGWQVQVCVDIDVDYTHAAGGDVWTDNSVHKAARGFRYELVRESDGAVLYEGRLGEAGSDAGCTATHSLLSRAFVRVHPQGRMGTLSFVHLAAAPVDTAVVAPLGGGRRTRVISYIDEAYAQLVAVSMALDRHPAGASDETIRLDHEGCCSTSNRLVHLSDSTDNKYKILHEVGHVVQHWRVFPILDVDAVDVDGCDGGIGVFRKEAQSHALKQGMANWYALITWNDKEDGDCDYRNGRAVDLDLDGTADIGPGESIDCGGNPTPNPPGTSDGVNWLRDVHEAGLCDGQLPGRSTIYDWQHYLWNLYSMGSGSPGDGLTAEQVLDILVEADPTTWTPEGDGSDPGEPWPRWEAAARRLSPEIQAAHDAQRDQVAN